MPARFLRWVANGSIHHHRAGTFRRHSCSHICREPPGLCGGAWTADAARKLTRLLDLAATFHLPVIHLEDCPRILDRKQSEEEATIRYGSHGSGSPLGQCTTPFCCIVIRKAFGVTGAANHKPGGHHMRAAWPSGDWGSLPIEGGIEVAYKAEIAEAKDPDAHLAPKTDSIDCVRPIDLREFLKSKKSSIHERHGAISASGPNWRAKPCVLIRQILPTVRKRMITLYQQHEKIKMSEHRQHSCLKAPAGATEILLVRHGESRATSKTIRSPPCRRPRRSRVACEWRTASHPSRRAITPRVD